MGHQRTGAVERRRCCSPHVYFAPVRHSLSGTHDKIERTPNPSKSEPRFILSYIADWKREFVIDRVAGYSPPPPILRTVPSQKDCCNSPFLGRNQECLREPNPSVQSVRCAVAPHPQHDQQQTEHPKPRHPGNSQPTE